MDRRAAGALLALALAACFATATAAPTSNQTALDLYDGPTEGCYYNFQHYGEGDRIMTNEPCLNCTCHNRMLMCYLRVCPFTKPIGQDCTVEKRADQCCPIVTCPDVPVDLLTSTSTTSPAEYGGTGVGKVDNYGCSINGKYFPEGAKVPPTPNKPCEHCYCIRNMTTCVMQECTLHVDGCTPIYHKDVCCPVRYFCDHPEEETLQLDDMTTTVRPTPGFLLTTTTTETPTTEIQTKRECTEDGQIYPDGALIKTEKPCVHCYCMKGDIVCVVQECGTPMENEGKNCTSMPPREGQCCPDTYICEGDEITTETPLEEKTTMSPLEITTRRESIEGSGYRIEPGETYTEPSLSFETEGSGEEEPVPTISSDLVTPKEPTTDNPIEYKFGVTDVSLSSVITSELPLHEVKEQASTEPDKGLNTVPSEISEHSEPSVIDNTTVQGDIMTTISSTSFVEETSMISTSQKPGTEMPETTSSGEITEKPTTISSVQIEDESSQTSSRGEDEPTESITESTMNTKLTTVLDQSNTTPYEKISAKTTESILTKQTTLKSDSMSEATMTEITPKEVYTEAAITEFAEHSSEPPSKEKTTTIHDIMVTESSATSEERDITSPVLQEQSTTQISEVTESVVPTEEQTSYKEIFSEGSSEPSLFDKSTSTDAITKSEVYKTTAPSIYEDDITVATTPKVVKEEEKSTEQTTAESYKTTTEKLVKETDATPKPLHEETFIPVVESEREPTTEQTSEHYINNETIPTFVPSTEVVPQDEKQDTTDATAITTSQPRDKLQPAQTTTLNPEDNEITEDILPPGRIPGEGDCLFNGVTYRNESSVPNRNKCESSCKCISSIIKCDPIICSPPPEYVENCQLVYDSSDSCCPTYICDQTKETIPPQSHSQMSGTEKSTSSPSLQCSGDECELNIEKQTSTVLPDLTKIASSDDCSSDGCINQIPEQVNIAGEQPEKCMGDKCTSECVNGNCQLPSSQEKPHTPPKTIPQACQDPEECQQNKTEIPECQGEDCISKTPTLPEISTPCEGDSCPGVSQDCTSDKCIVSDSVPPEKPLGSEICSGEKDCKQIEEKDCQDNNCRRTEDRIQTTIQPLPPKCNDQDCPQQELSSPDEELTVTMPTTEQVQSESTLSPESHSTSDITVSSSEKTTSIPHTTADHKLSESISTETSEKAETTQAPQITDGVEGENTVPHEDITETEIHYTEQPMLATSEVYTDKDTMITKTTETEREYTISPAVTESQQVFTSSPVESETQHEDMSSKPPESGFDETETEKPQTPLSEFEPKQPDQQEQFTRAPESEQLTEVTDFNTHDEQTELPVQHLPSTSIITTQKDISEVKTTPEYIEQSTILPDTTEKSGVSENIPTISEYTELPEKSEEQESTTLPPESEKQTTKLSLFDSTNQSTTQAQEFSSTSKIPIIEEEMKTDLPVGFVTGSLESVKEEADTKTTVSPDTILYNTESPLVTVEGDKVSTETTEIMSKATDSPTSEEQTVRTDSYLTSPQSIITETSRIPEEIITPEQEIQEVEQHTEMPTTESSLSFETKLSEEPDKTMGLEIPMETTRKPEELVTPEQETQEKEQLPDILTTESSLTLETKPSEEPDKIIEPEILTETSIPRISEPTETTMLQETTSEKVTLTEKPMQAGTELIIPVSITEEPSVDTKETEESLLCDSESECKKTQLLGAEMPPCQGESCIEVKEGCHSSECSQSGLPPKTDTTEICDKESGCEKPSQEASSECTDQNCKLPEISGIEITTKTPSILDEELHTEIPSEPHVAETEVPATKAPSFDFDKTTQEPSVEESEKQVTELPESIITDTPLATGIHKYSTGGPTDVTQESITPESEITTKEPKESETEHPSYHDTIPQKEITEIPEERFPTEQQADVTENPAPGEVTSIQESLTKAPEQPKSTERSDDITEQPKISIPEELTVKPEIDVSQTLIPEQPEPELLQPEITTTGYSEIASITEQDHKSKDEENETEGPETFVTTQRLSTREPEITTVTPQLEDKVSETTEAETDSSNITKQPQIIEKTTEPEKEYSETTPYLVELKEHPHEVKESITTLLPSEESITQEPPGIYDTEKEQVTEMSTQKPLQTETPLQYTENPSEDHVSSETIRTDAPTTISEEIPEKSTEPSLSEEASSEPIKPPSLDEQVPDRRFTTESKDQENEISTVASVLPETKQTTQVPPETEKPHILVEENLPETTQDTLSSTAGTFETSTSEEKEVTTKTTSPKTDEGIATQSPSEVDMYTKPETSTDVYPSVHTTETQKPVFSDMPPTDEAPQPEEESHFPPSGSYEPEPEPDYGEEFGPGTCRYGGKVYVSAQQIPRDDPCDFCFCFRSDIICLQQSCPPPIHGCHEEPIQGFCCPRYECPVSMATTLNVTTTTTTTTTTLPPHFLPHAYKGAAQKRGCQIKGHIYKVGEVVRASSGPCLHCTCGGDGQMKCDPKVCTPEPMLRQMIAAAVSAKRRR